MIYTVFDVTCHFGDGESRVERYKRVHGFATFDKLERVTVKFGPWIEKLFFFFSSIFTWLKQYNIFISRNPTSTKYRSSIAVAHPFIGYSVIFFFFIITPIPVSCPYY